MKRFVAVVLLGVFVALAAGSALSADKADKKSNAKMKYLVIAPHTPEQCLQALDDVNAMGPKSLSAWDFGCKADDHTGYLLVTAKSVEEVRAMIPASARDQAKIVMVTKFTPADIKSFHEQMNAEHH